MNESIGRFCSTIGATALDALKERLQRVNHDIVTFGIKDFEDRNLLTGYSYSEFYDWDLYFENIYLSYYGISDYCRPNLETFLGRQLKNGFVSRALIKPRHHQHFKPFLAQLALLHVRQTKDVSWLDGDIFDRLEKYLDYWQWYCDLDKNGLSVWDSSDHSGMDNQFSRAGVIGTWTIEGADLNCYLVREMQAMAVLAKRLGRHEAEQRYNRKGQDLWHTIDAVLWNEDDGFYYDRNERTGEPVRIKSASGLIPLWLDSVATEKAARLVNEHLANPKEFWLDYPVATWSKQEPDYDQDASDMRCNWRGTTWIPINYMLMHGLIRHGYKDLARELAYKTFEMVLTKNEATREFYNAETGDGKGLNPFWGWSCLAYFMPLEYEMSYDPAAITEDSIIPIAHELGIEFPAPPQ